MSALDNLRRDIAKAATRSQGDETPIIHTAAQLRAAVAEHDALRDAVRAYLAPLPAEELAPPCRAARDCAEAAVALAASKADGRDIGVCAEHARHYSAVAPLPPRVVTLRALAALVRS
mgnify:CR=1 FL=1